MHRTRRFCLRGSGFRPNVTTWAASSRIVSCRSLASSSSRARWRRRSPPSPPTTRARRSTPRSRAAPASSPATVKAGPYAVPGRISFVNYDMGGDGVGYHTEAHYTTKDGNGYRSDVPTATLSLTGPTKPDIFYDTGTAQDGTAYPNATDRDFYVGSVHPGDWFNYTVDVQTAGMYTLNANFSTGNGPPGGEGGDGEMELIISVNGTKVTSWHTVLPDFADKANFHNWKPYPAFATIALDVGLQVVKFQAPYKHLNLDVVDFALVGPDAVAEPATDGGRAADSGAATGAAGNGAGGSNGAAGSAAGAPAGAAGDGSGGSPATAGAAGSSGAAGSTTATGAAGSGATVTCGWRAAAPAAGRQRRLEGGDLARRRLRRRAPVGERCARGRRGPGDIDGRAPCAASAALKTARAQRRASRRRHTR